jgi:hypothetical protein
MQKLLIILMMTALCSGTWLGAINCSQVLHTCEASDNAIYNYFNFVDINMVGLHVFDLGMFEGGIIVVDVLGLNVFALNGTKILESLVNMENIENLTSTLSPNTSDHVLSRLFPCAGSNRSSDTLDGWSSRIPDIFWIVPIALRLSMSIFDFGVYIMVCGCFIDIIGRIAFVLWRVVAFPLRKCIENSVYFWKEAKSLYKYIYSLDFHDYDLGRPGPRRVTKEQIEGLECCICFVNKKNAALPCGHVFCPECLDSIGESDESRCPLCNKAFEGYLSLYL